MMSIETPNNTYLNSDALKNTMVNKGFFAFLLVFTLLITSVSALSDYGTKKVDEEFTFCQVCADSTYITLGSIETPNSTLILNSNMTAEGSGQFCYNYTPNIVGRYDFRGISDGCLKTFATWVSVTPNGEESNIQTSIIQFVLLCSFILMMVGFYRISKKINYEKWYESIKNKYITRNFVKWSLAAIAFNIMTNSFIIYFLLGLPIMLILVDLAFIYNITSITLYIQSLLYVYIAMIIVLGIVFLSFVQEWFMDFIGMIEDTDWGLDNDK